MLNSSWIRPNLILALILATIAAATVVQAQESPGSRFQPPPSMNDLDDDEIEELEGDMPGRPMIPDIGQQDPDGSVPVDIPPPPPMNRGAPTSFTKIGNNNNAIRFEIVEGEYFKKGKRRGRATDLRTPKSSSSNSGPPTF